MSVPSIRRSLAVGVEPAAAELDWRVALTHKEIFERYVHAGAITRNPDAVAARDATVTELE